MYNIPYRPSLGPQAPNLSFYDRFCPLRHNLVVPTGHLVRLTLHNLLGSVVRPLLLHHGADLHPAPLRGPAYVPHHKGLQKGWHYL